MRTTISIDDDLLDTVKYLANQRNVAIGRVLSDLARKGLEQRSKTCLRNNFPVFAVSKDATLLTPEHVKMLDDEE